MQEQNGEENPITFVELISQKSLSKYIYFSEDNNKNETKIEELLENDDNFNDLKTNRHSRYLKILTTDNIKKLINYCLNPKQYLKTQSPKIIRYPYYSCQILCSQNVLFFTKSIKKIQESNRVKKEKDDEFKINDKEDGNSRFRSKSFEEIHVDSFKDEIEEEEKIEEQSEKIEEDFYHFKRDFGNEEKYIQINETEYQKDSISKKLEKDYNEKEKNIIDEIIGEIFNMLDFSKEEPTFMGYFQKIINYLLFNESKVFFEFLFKEADKVENSLNKLLINLESAAIQNILENILNKLFDEEFTEKDMKNSKYIYIIKKIIEELKKDKKYEKAQFMCELIINTIINNTDTQLIDLAFKKEISIKEYNNQVNEIESKKNVNLITELKYIINKIIYNKEHKENIEKEEKYDEAMIGILQILCQLNSIIINSFGESSYFQKNYNYIDFEIFTYKKVNAFEYQYTIKKIKSNKKIFAAFKNNIFFYFDEIGDIYNTIKEDIKNKYNKFVNKKNNDSNNFRQFGMNHLQEWKYILSVLKLYIYSFYAVEEFSSENKYFVDEELFKIMITYHFDYPHNNIYQNLFIEIIKLICNEKCPEKIVLPFLKTKSQKQNNLIYKIIKNIKEDINNKNDKYKILLGTNIEVLRLFSSSFNPYILKIFESFQIDNMIKDIFTNSISPKYERKLLDDYDYSDSEIFNSDNDLNDTFDGNDENIKRKYESFQKIIQKFLEKYKKRKNKIDTKNNINEKQKVKNYEIEDIMYTLKEKKIIKYGNEENDFIIEMRMKFELKEEDISSSSSSED